MTDTQTNGRARQWRANIIIFVASILFALLAAELLARVMFPSWAPRTGRVTQFWQHDEMLGWAHKPMEEGRFESFGFDTFVRINSHGFRGPERTFERTDDRGRVIVLGDSFVWGFGVEEEQTFTRLVEDEFAGSAEIINLGVSGYSTDQELLLYRDTGRKYAADIVVLMIATNDFALNARPVAYVVYQKPVFQLDGDALILTNHPVPVTNWFTRSAVTLASHSFLLNQLNRTREAWNVRQAAPDPSSPSRQTAPRRFPRGPAETITMRLLAQMRDEVERDGADFLAVLTDSIYGGDLFTNALDELGIEYVALDEVMGESAGEIHLPDNLHWNAQGHALVAGAVTAKLSEMLAPPAAEAGGEAGSLR